MYEFAVFLQHRFMVVPARLNLYGHLSLLSLWCGAVGVLSIKLSRMVLSHICTNVVWETDMGVMICRLYKSMYSFVVISLFCQAANAVLDFKVSKEQQVTGVYHPMDNYMKTPDLRTPDMRHPPAETPEMSPLDMRQTHD
jgi:hypothetical protein